VKVAADALRERAKALEQTAKNCADSAAELEREAAGFAERAGAAEAEAEELRQCADLLDILSPMYGARRS
jgi:hypothetical protein